MARKGTTPWHESREMHTQDDADSSLKEQEKTTNKKEQTTAPPEKKLPTIPGKLPKRSVEPPEESRDQKPAGNKPNLKKSPSNPRIPPGGSHPRKKPKVPNRDPSGKHVNSDKKKPSAEAHDKESLSSPPQTDAGKETTKESASTYGASWKSSKPTLKADLKAMEDYITKMPNFHGYICREDAAQILKHPGDWLVRLSVPPSNDQDKKNKAQNLAKSVERTKGHKSTMQKVFVISVLCKGKALSPAKSNNRNLVIKTNNGKFSIDSVHWLVKLKDLFSHYQGTSAVHKNGEFQLLNPISLSKWEFQHEDTELLAKKLGEGAFGEVRVGRLTTKDPKKKLVEVAVKMLKSSADSVTRDQVEELLHETRIMRKLDHPNVLRSYGVAVLREPLYLMIELCSNGALREYLKENHKTITLADKINFVLGSARGVAYLHSQRILHRDLAVRNILLTEDKTPKVSDFGLAELTDRYEMKEHCKIPVRYLAPETLELFIFTPKTDVFSFGCVIWEIYENGQQPHDGKNAQTIRAQVKKREFLKLSSSAPEALRRLVAEKVFVADPENRCSMTSIVQCVETAEKTVK